MAAGECLHPLSIAPVCGGGATLKGHCQLRAGHDGMHRFIEMSPGETFTLTLEWRGGEGGDPAELPPVKAQGC